MDLLNKLPHMRGATILVNGSQLTIGVDGSLRGVSEDLAKRLLGNREAWTLLRTPTTAPTPAPVALPTPRPLPTPPPPAPEPAKPVLEPPPVKAEEKEEEREEWPDPTEKMDIAYLRQMADAYEVKYTTKTSKKVLVKAIKSAMYEE